MALTDNIQLHSFPDASLPAADGDYLYTSQGGSEFKIAISDLSDKFEVVDIYGLTESTLVNGDFFPFIDVSVGLTTAANRKVTAENLSDYTQEKQHYTTGVSIAEADTIVKRIDASEELTEITLEDFRDDVLNLTELATIGTMVDTDWLLIYDAGSSEPTKTNISNFRQKIFRPENLNEETELEDTDWLYIYDQTSGEVEKISYLNFIAELDTDLGFSNFVSLTGSQTISGSKTFSALTDFTNASGLSTDRINESSANNGVLIDSVLVKDNTVTAATVYGNYQPTAAYSTYLGYEYSGSWTVYDTIYNASIGAPTGVAGAFIELTGNNASAYAKGGIIPAADGSYSLGNLEREFDGIYSQKGYFSAGIQVGATSRLSSIYVNGKLLTDGGGVVNVASLPVASTSARGAIEIASGAEITGTSSNNALTPSAINNAGDTITSKGTAVDSFGATVAGTTLYAGAAAFGGLKFVYGYIDVTGWSVPNTKFRVNYLTLGFNSFSSLTSYTATLTNEGPSTSANDKSVVGNTSTAFFLDIQTINTGFGWTTERINFQVIGN